MLNEWKQYKLGDLAEIQTGPFGSQLHASDYVAKGVPCIMPTSIGARLDIIRENLVFITEKDAQRLSRHRVREGDIVYSRRGDVEKCAYITSNQNGWLCGTGSLRLRFSSDNVIPRFCAYYLSTAEARAWVVNSAVGTTMPNLNSKILRELPLAIPGPDKQRVIAAVLCSLDDKVDLLRRQNKTLEAMAETVFREWFVKDGEAAAKEITLSDIASHGKESISPSRQPDFTFLHYSVPAYDDGKEPKKEFGRHILSNKYRVYSDSILISKLNPRIPRVWPIFGKVDQLASICSTEFQVVRPNKKHYFGFIYCFLKSPSVTHELASAVGGTSGSHQRVDPEVIFELPLPQADEKRIEEFASITTPHWLKMNANNCEMRTLTQLRDTLLPKLMSGEVRVKA